MSIYVFIFIMILGGIFNLIMYMMKSDKYKDDMLRTKEQKKKLQLVGGIISIIIGLIALYFERL